MMKTRESSKEKKTSLKSSMRPKSDRPPTSINCGLNAPKEHYRPKRIAPPYLIQEGVLRITQRKHLAPLFESPFRHALSQARPARKLIIRHFLVKCHPNLHENISNLDPSLILDGKRPRKMRRRVARDGVEVHVRKEGIRGWLSKISVVDGDVVRGATVVCLLVWVGIHTPGKWGRAPNVVLQEWVELHFPWKWQRFARLWSLPSSRSWGKSAVFETWYPIFWVFVAVRIPESQRNFF